jgi:hypothetical protein
VFLSFLERERDRNFFNVSDRGLVQCVSERFRSFYERFRSYVNCLRRSPGIRIININGKKRP